MKIKTNIEVFLEQSDLNDILKGLPDYPCIKCGDIQTRIDCVGCQESKEYEKIISDYKKRNIYEYASLIKNRKEKQEKIEYLLKQMKEIDILYKEINEIEEKFKKELNIDLRKV